LGLLAPSRWFAALVLALGASSARASEAPPTPDADAKPNAPPKFVAFLAIEPEVAIQFSGGEYVLKCGRETRVRMRAQDPEGDPLTFAIDPLPEGATLDAAKGVLTWRPTRAQIGKHRVKLAVSDGNGTDRQDAVLVVRENHAPVGTTGPLIGVASRHPPRPTATDWNAPWEGIASDPDSDELTIAVKVRPPTAEFDTSKGNVSMSLRPTPADAGDHELVVEVSDGEETITVRRQVHIVAEWAARDYHGWMLPGGGASAFLLHGDRETLVGGALQATLVARTENGVDAFRCENDPQSSSCHASHLRIYAEFEVLGSTRADAASLFTYAAGYASNFEWNPARRYLIPHYGAEIGGLFRSGVGHRAQVRPYLGLHLWADRSVWLNLTLGYRVVPAGLSDLSGPTAGLVAMLNPF